MSGTAQLSVSLLTGEFPCPRDGTTLRMLAGGAWCPKCHTVWRESGEIVVPPPLADEIDRLRARVAELEVVVRSVQRKHRKLQFARACDICAPQDQRWPCLTREELDAVLPPEGEQG